MNYLYSLGVFLFLLFSSSNAYCQLVINEVSSNNYQGYADNEGDFSDWIELYNPGAGAIDLTGYGLTDNPTIPGKWIFPSVSIPGGGYLTIFASNKNTYDFIDHWESIAKESDQWKYLIPESEPSSSWRKAGFDDSGWEVGKGGFGYGDDDDSTIVPEGTKVIFLRKEFTVLDSATIQSLILDMDYDDGFVAYLNGTEIVRSNVTGTPNYDKSADADREAQMYTGDSPRRFPIDASLFQPLLKNGTNVFAIQIHNVSSSSSDLSCRPFLSCGLNSTASYFSPTPDWFIAPGSGVYLHTNFAIKAGGETIVLSNSSGTIVDQIAVPALEADNTYGRYPNGGTTWSLLATGTPGASNSSGLPFSGYVNDVVGFSLPAGFYSGSQSLSLSTSGTGCTIRYTTDGSKPSSSSTSYSSPISISSNRVVRAGCFRSGYRTRYIESNSYFINDDPSLPVVSISTHSGNFFSTDSGIYVKGPNAESQPPYYGANYWQDWEREVHVEYFESNGGQGFEQDLGVKIFGGWSRAQSMKTLRLLARDAYGPSKINYKLFKDKNITSFDQVILRSSGNDFNYTHMRDAINHKALVNPNKRHGIVSHMDFQAYQPVIVFINGEYWGVHNMRERISKHHAAENHGLDDDDIDFLEMEAVIQNGSNEHFLQLVNFIEDNDMTSTANFETVKQMLDIENYVDYFVAQTFHTNWDFPHNNIKYWRNRNGGKWRFSYYDTDFGYGLFDFNSASSDELSRIIDDTRSFHSSVFKKLLTNTEFKNYFVNRYADLLNTTYKSSNLQAVVDELKAGINSEMSRHFGRWPDNANSVAGWESNITGVRSFIDSRPGYARGHINSRFNLSGQVDVTVDVAPAGAGKVKISTVIPDSYPWTGIYFDGVPVVITAQANDGYVFSNWSGLSSSTDVSILRNISTDGTITANFTPSSSYPKVTFSEINYNSDSATSAGEWVELHNYGTADANLSGWVFKDDKDYNSYVIPVGTVLPAGGYLVLVKDPVKFSAIHPGVSNFIGSFNFNIDNGGDHLRLYSSFGDLKTEVIFDDASPWPLNADGGGTTLELKDPNSSLNSASNWYDGCMNGSPGTAYVPCPCTQFELGADRILCMEDGAVELNTGLTPHPDRIFKWFYNGQELSGYNFPALTAASAGEYSVIVDSAKCFKSDYVNIKENLTVDLGPDIGLCSPMDHTFQSGIPENGVVFQWERDGEVLEGENRGSLYISSLGTYRLTVTAGTCPSTSDEVIVRSDAAKPIDSARCGEGSVTLGIDGTSSYEWYSEPTGGTLLGSGDSFTTPVLYDTTTYYVEDAGFFYYTGGPVDNTFGDSWSHEDFSTYKLKFNVLAPFVLRSVTVYAGGSQDVTIRVLDSDGSTVLHSKTVTVGSSGKHIIPLGFELSVGDGYFMDAVGTTGSLRMNNENSSFPYEVPGYLSIYRTVPDWADDQGWYFFFYNWEVTSGPGPCERVPVTAYINCMELQAYITPESSTTFCEGGSVNLVANSRPTYTYRWFRNDELISAATSSSYVATTSGYYKVEVSDETGSVMSEAVTVLVSSLPPAEITASGPLEFCQGGSVSLTTSSGSGYSYRWYRNGTSISNATAISYTATTTGEYSVRVTVNGCTASSSPVTVTAHPYPTSTITASGPTGVCEGETVTLTSPTGTDYTYQWYKSAELLTGETLNTLVATETGDYSVNVSANGCTSASFVVKVSVAPAPAATISASGPTNICQGQELTLNASTGSGYTYQWYDSGTAISNATSSYYNVTSSGNYSVEVILNGCSSLSTEIAASISPSPTATVTADGPTSFCEGESVILTAPSDANYSYQWYKGGVAIPDATLDTYAAAASGDYTVKTTLGTCSATSSATIVTVNSVPSSSVTASGPTTICEGQMVTLTASTGTNYTYQWYNGATGIEGATTNSYVASATGEYTVRVAIGNCSSVSTITSVVVNPKPDATIIAEGETVFCEGQMVTLTASTGTNYTYQWYNSGVLISDATDSTYIATTTGDYTVVATANACSSTSSAVTVTVTPLPEATVTASGPTNLCEGETVTLSASSGTGYSYQWLDSGTPIQTATEPTYVAGASGEYSVQVSTGNCSTASSTTLVSVAPTPQATITTSGPNSFCEGESVRLAAPVATDYTYQWFNDAAAINGATDSVYTATSDGNYTVQVSLNNCSSTSSITAVSVNESPIAEITATGATNFCQGESVSLTATQGIDYTYQWLIDGAPITAATTGTYTASLSGSYTVTVTSNSCSKTSLPVTVTVNPKPVASVSALGDTVFCEGGSVLLEATKNTGYSWQWMFNGSDLTDSTNATLRASEGGKYAVRTTANGCFTVSPEVEIQVKATPAATITANGPATFCSGGSVILNAPAGTGYTYQWKINGSNISEATASAYTATTSGTFSVSVVSNGCINTSSGTTVTSKPLPTAAVVADGPPSFCQGSSVSLNASTGTGYLYQWYKGAAAISDQTSASFVASESGSYSVNVTLNGCSRESNSIAVNVTPAPSDAYAGDDQTVCSSQAELNATAPAAGTGSWELISGTGTVTIVSDPKSTITGLETGNNILSWTVNNGDCPSSADTVIILVTETSAASVSVSSDQNPVCQGSSVVFTASTVNGGESPVFDWYVNNVSVGVNSKTYTRTAPSDKDSVYVVMSSSLTCATGSPATSNKIALSVSGTPSVASAGDDQEICSLTGNLAANAPTFGVGHWMLVSGNATLANPTSPGTEVTFNSIGSHTFRWTIQNDPCQASSEEVVITVNEAPTQAIAGDDQYITTSSALLEANFPEVGTGTWSVTNGKGTFAMETDPLTEVTALGEGENILRWTIQSGVCEVTYDEISVHVGQVPVTGDITGPDSVVLGKTYTYSIPADPTATFFWTVPSGASITSGQGSNTITVVFVTYSGGNITVTKTTMFGIANESKAIYEKKNATGFGPTYARNCKVYPNPADGDVFFKLTGSSYEEVDIVIVNQKGVVRYVLEDVRSNEAILLPELEPDVYVIQIKGLEGTEFLKLVKVH